MSRLVLGINSVHADSSAALISENGIVAAIAEERINRIKHCAGFPKSAIEEILRIGGASIQDVTDIAIARDPKANLQAKLAYLARNPVAAVPQAIGRLRAHREAASASQHIADSLGVDHERVRAAFHHVEHHVAHVASAFFWSPFERATGISVDGAGDFASSLIATCVDNELRAHRRTLWPHSLGILYTAICQFIGFTRFGEEYKVMGLSAYGANRFVNEMRQLVSYDPARGIVLNLRFFSHHKQDKGLEIIDKQEVRVPPLYSDAMRELFGEPRKQGEPLTDRDRDLAASLQLRFEDIYLEHVATALRTTGIRDVVMAGGSVLNSVGNGRMITERYVDRAYFHPAASDDGTAVGAAVYVMHARHGIRRSGAVTHAYWGSSFNDEQIEKAVISSKLPFTKLATPDLLAIAAKTISQGKIVGWFQGREEWGPRALGNRSILCHPGWAGMKATLNARIKNREPFRPFAPAILEEKLSTCFLGEHEVPFMIAVYKVRPEWKERLSATTHEDGTGRVQTVRREQNPLYYDLIAAFEKVTGIPVLLNTSFNENEPIVHTPEQAIDCFARTRMDALGIGPFFMEKPAQAG